MARLLLFISCIGLPFYLCACSAIYLSHEKLVKIERRALISFGINMPKRSNLSDNPPERLSFDRIMFHLQNSPWKIIDEIKQELVFRFRNALDRNHDGKFDIADVSQGFKELGDYINVFDDILLALEMEAVNNFRIGIGTLACIDACYASVTVFKPTAEQIDANQTLQLALLHLSVADSSLASARTAYSTLSRAGSCFSRPHPDTNRQLLRLDRNCAGQHLSDADAMLQSARAKIQSAAVRHALRAAAWSAAAALHLACIRVAGLAQPLALCAVSAVAAGLNLRRRGAFMRMLDSVVEAKRRHDAAVEELAALAAETNAVECRRAAAPPLGKLRARARAHTHTHTHTQTQLHTSTHPPAPWHTPVPTQALRSSARARNLRARTHKRTNAQTQSRTHAQSSRTHATITHEFKRAHNHHSRTHTYGHERTQQNSHARSHV